MTDRELEIIYVQGCVESQAEGLRRVFGAGVLSGRYEVEQSYQKADALKTDSRKGKK